MNLASSVISFAISNKFPEILKKELSLSPLPETKEKTWNSSKSGSVTFIFATVLPLGCFNQILLLLKIIFVGGSFYSYPNNSIPPIINSFRFLIFTDILKFSTKF